MKNIITLYLLTTLYIFANINTVVSIMPQKTFVQAIGGDKVTVSLMVEPGNSPHTYEPKPSQMVAIAKADLYFAIDIEFEGVWLPKFVNLNQKMEVIDLSHGIEKLNMTSDGHVCSAHGTHEHNHNHPTQDPHIWTSPKNVKLMAQGIYKALAHHDAANETYYKKNLDLFLNTIENTDKAIRSNLSSLEKNRNFMVFHPSWGYFAHDYNLEQISIEVEGKSPKPKELITIIKKAREKKVKAIFTQPEFSDASARIIARELGIPVVKLSNLAPNWSENLREMAKVIGGQK